MRLKEIAQKAGDMKGTTFEKAYGNVAYIIGHDMNAGGIEFKRVSRGTYQRVG